MPDEPDHRDAESPAILNLLRDRFDALLIANGTPPNRKLFSRIRKRADHLIALDGGVNTLFRYKAVPDIVAGDLDSATARSLRWAREHGARIRRLPSPEAPDISKGLELCRGLGFKHVIVAGFTGERTDHVLAALVFSLRVRGIDVVLISDDVIAFPLRGRVERDFSIPRNHTISWFAFSRAGPCSLTGVRWPFRNRILNFDGFHSLSNHATSGRVHLSQRAGRSILIVSLHPQVRT